MLRDKDKAIFILSIHFVKFFTPVYVVFNPALTSIIQGYYPNILIQQPGDHEVVFGAAKFRYTCIYNSGSYGAQIITLSTILFFFTILILLN